MLQRIKSNELQIAQNGTDEISALQSAPKFNVLFLFKANLLQKCHKIHY